MQPSVDSLASTADYARAFTALSSSARRDFIRSESLHSDYELSAIASFAANQGRAEPHHGNSIREELLDDLDMRHWLAGAGGQQGPGAQQGNSQVLQSAWQSLLSGQLQWLSLP
jgi:hypothetical protein